MQTHKGETTMTPPQHPKQAIEACRQALKRTRLSGSAACRLNTVIVATLGTLEDGSGPETIALVANALRHDLNGEGSRPRRMLPDGQNAPSVSRIHDIAEAALLLVQAKQSGTALTSAMERLETLPEGPQHCLPDHVAERPMPTLVPYREA
jgi:hypothetical protein